MTFLPIVERELRVAARRRTTFRVRFLAAAATTVLGGLFLAAASLPGRSGTTGNALFPLLVWLEFAAAALAGPLLTADCLSRERREGTLGFLFLTDLNGLDVVAGKFAALGLVPLHGLLAVFPITALTVFLGGVTAGEFWRAHSVVLNTLFLSMAVGLWISSVLTDERQAVGLTLGTLVALFLLPELLALALDWTPFRAASEWLRAASPWITLLRAFESTAGLPHSSFWPSLGYQHALSWVFLLLAATTVRTSWRRDSLFLAPRTIAPTSPPTPTPALSPRRLARLARYRQEQLRKDKPFAWVAWRDSWIRRAVPWITGATALSALGLFAVLASLLHDPTQAALTAGLALGLGLYLLKFLMVVHSAYFLHDLCRSGTMELLLTTPISSYSLREGHLSALREMFLRPALLLGALQILTSCAGRWLAGGDWPNVATLLFVAIVPPTLGLLVHLADFLAAAYHISFMSFRYDRPTQAITRTTLMTLALPLLLCSWGRILVDLFVIGQYARTLDRFRDLAHAWYFRSDAPRAFAAPRPE